jgi:hypothetical protein
VGRCRKVKIEGGKGRERIVGKAAGDEYVFIPGEGPGCAASHTVDLKIGLPSNAWRKILGLKSGDLVACA